MRNRSRNDEDSFDDFVPTDFTPGPEPLQRDKDDPNFVRKPVGFVWPKVEPEPLVWDGDQA